MVNIIGKRKIYYTISGILIAASLGIAVFMGLRLGIDFTGGSLLGISYTEERPTPEQINQVITENGIESLQLQAVGENGYLLRMRDITEEERRAIVAGLKEQIGDTGPGIKTERLEGADNPLGLDLQFETSDDEGEVKNRLIEDRFETIGPVIGQELQSRSLEAIFVVLLAILIYIAWAFRKVSWPVQSWKYGISALITLFHDVIIVMGVFTLLTHLFGWEINTAFVAAVLTIVGYSVNDTIVVFDRVRENVPRMAGSFEEVVNTSVNQTISRSLNTSFTTLLVLVAIAVFGGDTIRSFVVALSLGVLIGTYSSIFIASPLLVSAQLRSAKKS